MHITGEIDQVGGGQLTAPEDAAMYLINFNGQAALVFRFPSRLDIGGPCPPLRKLNLDAGFAVFDAGSPGP